MEQNRYNSPVMLYVLSFYVFGYKDIVGKHKIKSAISTITKCLMTIALHSTVMGASYILPKHKLGCVERYQIVYTTSGLGSAERANKDHVAGNSWNKNEFILICRCLPTQSLQVQCTPQIINPWFRQFSFVYINRSGI